MQNCFYLCMHSISNHLKFVRFFFSHCVISYLFVHQNSRKNSAKNMHVCTRMDFLCFLLVRNLWILKSNCEGMVILVQVI